MTVCEKPQGHNELTDEEYQHKKGVTVAKRNHGVIDGKEPDPEA